MLGPHRTGASPVIRAIIAASARASSRRFGSATAARKRSTFASVGCVLLAAIALA
jgi:hypothetical protein